MEGASALTQTQAPILATLSVRRQAFICPLRAHVPNLSDGDSNAYFLRFLS